MPVTAQYWGEAFWTTDLPSKPSLVISGFAESSENSAIHVRDASSGQLTIKLSAVAATVTTPGRTPEISAGIVAATTHMGIRRIGNLITFSIFEPTSAPCTSYLENAVLALVQKLLRCPSGCERDRLGVKLPKRPDRGLGCQDADILQIGPINALLSTNARLIYRCRMRVGPTTVTRPTRCMGAILEIRSRTNERTARRPAESGRIEPLPRASGYAHPRSLCRALAEFGRQSRRLHRRPDPPRRRVRRRQRCRCRVPSPGVPPPTSTGRFSSSLNLTRA